MNLYFNGGAYSKQPPFSGEKISSSTAPHKSEGITMTIFIVQRTKDPRASPPLEGHY